MGRRLSWLFLITLLAITAAGSLFRLPYLVYGFPDASSFPGSVSSKLDAALLEHINTDDSAENIRFIVYLSSKAQLSPSSLPQDKHARSEVIVERLQTTAGLSQTAVRSELVSLQKQGLVFSYNPLWIINGIAVTGNAASVYLLADHPDVERIALDQAHRYFDHPQKLSSPSPNEMLLRNGQGTAWGVAHIQADKVWQYLGIKGEGVTVAVVDSGVDLNHPDLFANYRGNLADGTLTHEKNWFHTTIPTSTEPFDLLGHGTHVAGIAVGQNGIGVAPGAKWIAVSIADEYGLIYDSSIHAAFQWLLAPGGDTSAAPDVVNNSWGGKGARTAFLEDVNILHAAGIITVFAAGNDGSAPGSVHVPGSYTNTISVGASDNLDQPAWFSGRGPSPFNNEIKPLLLAPGTQILSALPGGKHAAYSGTSMATPHVTGAIALLMSAQPGMTQREVVDALVETAVPLTTTHPNFDSGWGRLDAFAAVLSQRPNGILQGTISDSGGPIAAAPITASTQDGFGLSKTSDQNGLFHFRLPLGRYDLSASVFGYENANISSVDINAGQTVSKELILSKKPSGQIAGHVTDEDGTPVEAAITVTGTPIEILTAPDGRYQFEIPAGSYELLAQAAGRKLERLFLQISANQEKDIDIVLAGGPSILLIDSGQWRYESALSYYRNALIDNELSYDLWSIYDPTRALPTVEDLTPYEIVIWSAPTDSPGRLSLNQTLVDYLDEGGRLLISGQNLADLDGHPGFEESWFRDYLKGRFAGELIVEESNPVIKGADGTAFSELSLTLNGTDSAGNQETPDLVDSLKGAFSKPVFLDENGLGLGLQAGFCEPYRMVHLGFGLEGVSSRKMRADVMQRSIETLLEPRAQYGVRWLPEQQHELVVPGEQFLLDIEVQNLSEVITDTFDLSIRSNSQWQGSLLTETITLEPCSIGQTSLVLDLESDLAGDEIHNLQLSAVSRSNPQTKAVFDLQLKTPSQILLVDDDRFYDAGDTYKTALDEVGLDYDLWDTMKQNAAQAGPPINLLNAYEFVIWFTGYDWHAPITKPENAALVHYLQQGGRLFLSSQDFLYYNQNTPLFRELGIVDYQESVTPTLVYADDALSLSPELAGPMALNYDPYQNFSDGLIPMNGSVPFLWHNQGMLAGVARTGTSVGRSIFWGFPFETLPTEQHPTALAAIMGWLTDIGDSSFVVDQQRAPLSEPRTYTLTLRNASQITSNRISITNTLPADMFIVPGSLDEDVYFSPAARRMTWQGQLAPAEVRQISYQAWPDETIPSGSQVINSVTIHDGNQDFVFELTAPLWLGVPDLSQSTLTSVATNELPTGMVTYSLTLNNNSLIDSEYITANLRLPDALSPLTNTLQTSKGDISLEDHRLIWTGSVNEQESITTTLILTHTALSESWLPATAIIDDAVTNPIILHDLRYIPPFQLFFPIFAAD